jgi:DNA-binding protein HU-beta
VASSINRLDLVNAVVEATGIPKPKAMQAVDAVFATMEGALRGRQEVRLAGFGSFTLSERKATKGRNPRTGEELQIPASTSVRFRPGKGLKDAVSSAE